MKIALIIIWIVFLIVLLPFATLIDKNGFLFFAGMLFVVFVGISFVAYLLLKKNNKNKK